ncbi:MAG: hypothetical protein DWI02_02345 [Planctomycetota bacterium]|nr:MAG: hypothetical protein DWI02_02345 [Planctomycetota bacterium]
MSVVSCQQQGWGLGQGWGELESFLGISGISRQSPQSILPKVLTWRFSHSSRATEPTIKVNDIKVQHVAREQDSHGNVTWRRNLTMILRIFKE